MRTLALTVALIIPAFLAPAEDIIRIGMIGLDTSHVIAFAKVINDAAHPDHVPGAKVVAAFKGGSPDVEISASRVEEYTTQLQTEFGVEIVDSIETLCTMVDTIMLMSVDGRPHLAQATPVFEAGLPLFIDKPLAGSLADAIAIQRLGEEHGVKWFSSSSYRYYDTMQALQQEDIGELRGAISYGPCTYEPHHPDLFWYGVHPTEALYTVMGTGCESVVRTHTDSTDVVTGVWKDGKVGTLRGLRDQATPHQVILFGTKKVAAQPEGGDNYAPLVHHVIRFFQTGDVPIAPEETIELFAFMTAADVSKERGGVPVTIAEVMAMAEAELAAR
jgi:hypothetical protein